MKIAIVGVGGTGGFFGWLLARSGLDVLFVARGRTLEGLVATGLDVASPRFESRTLAVRAVAQPREAVDVVLVCVKAYDLTSIAQPIAGLLSPVTTVIGLQNGIADTLDEMVGGDRVIHGVAQVIASADQPGRIKHQGGGSITLGESSGHDSARLREIVAALAASGIDAKATPDIRFERWRKLTWIAAQAGLTCLRRCGMGQLMATPADRQLFRDVLTQAQTVALADGVRSPPGLVDALMELADTSGKTMPQATSSMCGDLEAGRPLEVDFIHGALLRAARRHGIQVPAIERIYETLAPLARGAAR